MKTNQFITMVMIGTAGLVLSSCMTEKKLARYMDQYNRQSNVIEVTPDPNTINFVKPVDDIEWIDFPCFREALDTEEYLVGFGTNTNVVSQTAIKNAMAEAKAQLLSKYVGAYKSGLKSYSKNNQLTSGEQASMAKIESGVISACESAINTFVLEYCHGLGKDRFNNYVACSAVRVYMDDVKDKVMNEIESMDVDINADKFELWMEQEIAARQDSINRNLIYGN